MLVYWIVWISIIILASMCQIYDYPLLQELSTSRVFHKRQAMWFFISASILLIMIAGCRYYVGADFGAYYRGYAKYLDFLSALKTLEEPGIRLIYSLAVRIHDSGGMCILAVAAVTLGLELFILYRNTNNLGFALICFTFTCWSACFNGVRQALAAAVLFCGFPFLRDKKFVKYAIVVFLAFLCHRSALVMVLIYFIANRKVDVKNVIILIVASVIVLLSYDKVYTVMNVVMDNEVTGNEAYWSTSVNILRVMTKIVPAVFFLFEYKDIKKKPAVCFYLNILLIHAVVGITTANSACLARMGMYTMPFAVIAMAELLKGLPEEKRRISTIVILLLFGFMEFYECYNSGSLNTFRLRWIW